MRNVSRKLPGLLGCLCLVGSLAFTAGGAETRYRLQTTIPVGGEGGWDYLSVDEPGRRLYVSHGTKIVVIDLDQETVVGQITNTPGVHGFAPAPDLGRGFSSNGSEGKSSMVDLKTLQTLDRIQTGQNPDAMLYEPERQQVYMFNGRGKSATVIDAKAGKVISTIPLGGKPEFAQADSKAGLIFNNLEDKNEVVVIDAKKHEVLHHWPIAPGESASGMAIDVENHRLFLGCENKLMLMMDNQSGRVVASVPIGSGVDANAFDPKTKLAFASCGDGTVTIAHEETPDKLTVVQTLETERGAKTMALDPKTHRIYLASAKFEAAQPGQRRGRIVPNTFKVLVYTPERL